MYGFWDGDGITDGEKVVRTLAHFSLGNNVIATSNKFSKLSTKDEELIKV
jgi:hypothetical protein